MHATKETDLQLLFTYKLLSLLIYLFELSIDVQTISKRKDGEGHESIERERAFLLITKTN